MSFKIRRKLKVNYFYNTLIISSILFAGFFLLPKTAYLANINALDIIELTNKERIDNNLEKLEFNPFLKKAAYAKAKFLLENQIFTHNTKERKFSDWVREVNYDYYYVGENLAINFTENNEVIKAWMESKGHRENILSEDYKEIGVSVLEGEFENRPTYLVVQIFGSTQGEKKILMATSSLATSTITSVNKIDNKNKSLNNANTASLLSLFQNNKIIFKNLIIIFLSFLITILLSYFYLIIYSHLIK